MRLSVSFKPVLIAGMLALPLTACGTDLQNIREVSTGGDSFDNKLTQEYRDLAIYEADEMVDWKDAYRFAEKGLQAADGQRPVPEMVEDWDLAYGKKRLSDARKRLVALLARDAASRSPQLAAKAQASYDCWLEQLEEGTQPGHIAACHQGFEKSVIALEKELSEPTRIWFGFNEIIPDETFIRKIRSLANESKRLNTPLISVVGYADTYGSERNNMKVSLNRADWIKKLMINHGIPENRIAISAYGEKRTRIETGDQVKEAGNRRVEIMFYPQVDA